MLCSICHKNEAVICYTEIVNGVKKEQYLCPECAAKYTAFDSDASGLTPGNLLAGLLSSVLGQTGVALDDDIKKTNLVCHNCGMTYNEFLKYGKFGCPECVHTFGFLLDDYLKKIQGSCEHCGKAYEGMETVVVPDISFVTGDKKKAQEEPGIRNVPGVKVSAEDSDEIAGLKRKLAKAIQDEEYEEAAHLRDTIRAMSGKEAKHDENVV
ncbi:MAG TPA: UvrB/UvrC motif-containing protein [Candidatus Scybalocola faecavium]|nr:UvrB/UvrC motif-containing protein [Candidatus Scybalocola faecavium]